MQKHKQVTQLFKNLCCLFDSPGNSYMRGNLVENNAFFLLFLSTYPFCQKNRCRCSPGCCWKAGLCRNSVPQKGLAEPWVGKWLSGRKPFKIRDMNVDNFKGKKHMPVVKFMDLNVCFSYNNNAAGCKSCTYTHPQHTQSISRTVMIAPQPLSSQVKFLMDRWRTPGRQSWPHKDIIISWLTGTPWWKTLVPALYYAQVFITG